MVTIYEGYEFPEKTKLETYRTNLRQYPHYAAKINEIKDAVVYYKEQGLPEVAQAHQELLDAQDA